MLYLAASCLPSTTIIKLASCNYQVQDVCVFLRKLGVKIQGIGTTTLKIQGKKTIKRNVQYQPAQDPVAAMTFISAAVTTNSNLLIKQAPLDFLELELLKLENMGLKTNIVKEYLAANNHLRLGDLQIHKHNAELKALTDKISCRPFPGLNIDNLPYFVPIAASAKGTTLIHDWVYEGRALYYKELNNIGAKVRLADPHRVYVTGPTRWKAANLVCPPAIRPATINLIAMLAAPGKSTLTHTYSINRGYENIAQSFNALGAKIESLKDF